MEKKKIVINNIRFFIMDFVDNNMSDLKKFLDGCTDSGRASFLAYLKKEYPIIFKKFVSKYKKLGCIITKEIR